MPEQPYSPDTDQPTTEQQPQQTGDYQFDREEGRVRINLQGSEYGASIEDFEVVMARVIDVLMELDDVQEVILARERDYEYGWDQVKLLNEVASTIARLKRDPKYTQPDEYMQQHCQRMIPHVQNFIQELLTQDLRRDPVGAYIKVKRKVDEVKVKAQNAPGRVSKCYGYWLDNRLTDLKDTLETLQIIQEVEDELAGYRIGDREIYRELFYPTVRPNFMLTRYMRNVPENSRELDRYEIESIDTDVQILEVGDDPRPRYHITPPEFNLNDQEYRILDEARRYMSEHRPQESEFAEPGRTREIFFNIGKDMIMNIAEQHGANLSPEKVDQLSSILTRYTAGLGIMEILLADQKIQDIYVNAPVGNLPIYLIHADYGECQANLIPTRDDVESWATRFRLKSGRPLDEANPVMDTSAEVPGGRARVAIVTQNLSPDGLAYAFRRHRSEPWTFPLEIDVDYMTPLAAGLLHFIIDGARSVLYAGTRSAGKSSLLGASLVELMKTNRIVSVEDSVTGDSPLLYRKDGDVHHGTIGELIDTQLNAYGGERTGERDILRANPDSVEVLSMTDKGDLHWSPVSLFMRHEVEKPIYKVETRTGRTIKVTADHSLFTMAETIGMEQVKPTELEEGDHIVTPRQLPIPSEERSLNLLNHLDDLQGYVKGNMDLRAYRERLEQLAEDNGYSPHTVKYWIREQILPGTVLDQIDELVQQIDPAGLQYKHKRASTELPVEIDLDERFMEFLGLWMADGCYDNRSVLITVSDTACQEVINDIFERFDIPAKEHSDGHTLLANSQPLKEIMQLIGFTGDAYSKRIPGWLFSAADHQRRAFLRGLYSGDGYATENEIGIDLINNELINDIQTLLLIDEVRGRARDSGKMRSMRISDLDGMQRFLKTIGFIQDYKQEKPLLESKRSTHETTDVIPLPRKTLQQLCTITALNTNDYITRSNNLGRQKLKGVIGTHGAVLQGLETASTNDIFWDQVKSVKKVADEETVYDVSVPGDENFVTGNILAHNTLELPLPYLEGLGYNVERLQSESAIVSTEGELTAADAIRTSLRLGDSSLIVGEVRSTEAQALYEAMRVGALANYVAGTIHGEDPYSVFDRVVNDLGVPATSFKATDIVVTCNRLTSPSGLHKYRRITGIAEIRKEWTENPLEENAFVPLMKYDANEDKLKPTDTLLNGESVILNSIASNTREWKNDWEAVWNNIQLRARYKQKLVDVANKTGRNELMEADFVVKANETFHMLSEDVMEEVGSIDTEIVFDRWTDWLDEQISE